MIYPHRVSLYRSMYFVHSVPQWIIRPVIRSPSFIRLCYCSHCRCRYEAVVRLKPAEMVFVWLRRNEFIEGSGLWAIHLRDLVSLHELSPVSASPHLVMRAASYEMKTFGLRDTSSQDDYSCRNNIHDDDDDDSGVRHKVQDQKLIYFVELARCDSSRTRHISIFKWNI